MHSGFHLQGLSNSYNSLIFIKDIISQKSFLVDTGSTYSLIPCCFSSNDIGDFSNCNVNLEAANGTSITTFGNKRIKIAFNFLKKPTVWNFVVANITIPILGLDFLRYFNLMVDCGTGQVISKVYDNQYMHFDSKPENHYIPVAQPISTYKLSNSSLNKPSSNTLLSKLPLITSNISSPNNSPIIPSSNTVTNTIMNINNNSFKNNSTPNTESLKQKDEHSIFKSQKIPTQHITQSSNSNPYTKLLDCYSALTKDFDINAPIKHSVIHRIETVGKPVIAKCRRLNINQLDFLEKHLNELLAAGIIEPSDGPWSSPIHLVAKPVEDEKGRIEYRVCGDYRALNAVTIADTYPIPFIEDFPNKLHGAVIFSKLDLKKAYFHIPIHPEDKSKTTITTPLGAYRYCRLNFGLKNAPSSWSRFIQEVLKGLYNVFFYLDDILVFSNNEQEHVQHVESVFKRLNAYGLLLNVKKCVFGVRELDYLGYRVTTQGIQPQDSKITVIKNFPVPINQKQLRNFIGLISYYHKFIPNAAKLLLPFHGMVIPGKASLKSIYFDEDMMLAFNNIKNELIKATLLVHPSKDATISVATDSSSNTIAGVLQQLENGTWKPLAFCSRKLTKTEQKYSIFSRELLAVYFAVKKFRYFLEYREFHIYTDHKPICSAIKKSSENYLPREFRHLEYISAFTTDIRYVKGSENVPADALTRVTMVRPSEINYEEIAEKQQNDPELSELKKQDNFKFVSKRTSLNKVLWVDVFGGKQRPYIPEEFRFKIFQHFHVFSHPGIRGTQKLICERFLWKNMRKDIKQWVTMCSNCQESKVVKHTKTPLQSIEEPDTRFNKIHIDIVTLPYNDGYRYLLTIIDRFTRWPEAIPIKNAIVDTIIENFVNIWVSRYGVPKTIVTDNGPQFLSGTWVNFLKDLNIRHIKTSVQHPQSQGIIERLHRTIKQALRATGIHDWVQSLPWILLSIRAVVKEEIKASPAEILYGMQLRLPGEFFEDKEVVNDASIFVKQLSNRMKGAKFFFTKKFNDKGVYVNSDLDSCAYVYVRNDSHNIGIKNTYLGPFRVLRRTSKYMILENYGKNGVVSLNRLKPAYF